jgi:hypothetical protein
MGPNYKKRNYEIEAENLLVDRCNLIHGRLLAFLWVMGVAGGASLFALLSATKSLAALQSDGVSIPNQTTTDVNSTTSSGNSTYSEFGSNFYTASGSCSLQCGKHCSYPGHCRRYTDSDGDNFCDFGECS